MPNKSKGSAQASKVSNQAGRLQSTVVSDRGIKTTQDLSTYLTALLSDISSDRIDAVRSNARCNVAGKLLKTAEMEFRYGGRRRESNGHIKLS